MSGDEFQEHFLGEVTADLINQLYEQVRSEVPDEVAQSVKQSIMSLQPHELAAFTLSQILGQLAIKHNDIRLFYGSISCLWFSGLTDGLIRERPLEEMMDMADELWEETQQQIESIISTSVDNLLDGI